jgi:hypothetical protein
MFAGSSRLSLYSYTESYRGPIVIEFKLLFVGRNQDPVQKRNLDLESRMLDFVAVTRSVKI